MQKIDRLGWTAGLTFTAYGTRFGLRVNEPAMLERVRSCLPLEWEPADSAEVDFLYSLLFVRSNGRPGWRPYHLLYTGSARLARTMDLAELFERLESHLELLTAFLARGHLFVHAGVVGWQGRAIIIPGRTFSGKTTLVKALIEAGASYYSDEYAIFDETGQVHPYPIALAIRDESGRNRQKTPVEALGGQAGIEPLPAGLVVVTTYRPGARWQPRRLSPARALLALMDNTVVARRGSEFSMPILRRVVERAAAVKSARGEAAEVVTPLLKLVKPD